MVAVVLPFLLITFGELEVPSGLTAVLISPAALFVAMLAPFIDPSERIDRRQAVGLVGGLAGVALVVGVESIHSLWQFLGAMAMIGAAILYALSGFVVKGPYKGLSAVQTSFISLSVAAVVTLPIAAATTPSEAPGPARRARGPGARRRRHRARVRHLLQADRRGRRRPRRRSSVTWRRASPCSTARSSSTRRSPSPRSSASL